MGNKVPYTPELAARIISLYRKRVCVRLIVELTRCSVAQAKRAIKESPTRDQDSVARIVHRDSLCIQKPSIGDTQRHGPDR